MTYLLGIDFGGGASKATLLDGTGKIVAESTVEYPTLYTEDGGCEQSPSDWEAALLRNTGEILQKSGVNPRDIVGVALDSATHTFLLADESFRPLSRAIHWTDTRSRAEADALQREKGEEIFSKTFHKPDTIWTLPQLLWLRRNQSELFRRGRYVFFEKDYLRYLLTDVYATDYIEAEGSMLFNCNEMQWDGELCALAGITPAMLPPVKNPTDIVGSITPKAAKMTGLAEGTAVICGTTDTALEVLASGAIAKGDTTVKLATAGRICVMTEEARPDRHLVNYSHVVKGLWYPGTATKAAASSYRWYRDTFGGDYAEMDKAAAEVPIGAEGLFYHPYLKGELTPYADPTLCASFTGMRATHTKAHFSRAVLEGVALSLLDSKAYLESIGIQTGKTATLIGGGAKSPLWSQIVADALGMELRITQSSDSSLGAAMLAGVALGVFKSFDEAIKLAIKTERTVTPIGENTEKYQKLFAKYKKIQKALAEIYRENQ